MQAWGDESGTDLGDEAWYLLTAVLVHAHDAESVRSSVRGLLLPSQCRLHWHEESGRRRRLLSAAVANLPLRAVVVARCGPATEPDERRRRKRLETLADVLERRGCRSLVLESRGPRADRRDRDMLDALRSRRIVSALRLSHQAAGSDPLLWVADMVCGAVAADLRGEPSHRDLLAASVEVVRVVP